MHRAAVWAVVGRWRIGLLTLVVTGVPFGLFFLVVEPWPWALASGTLFGVSMGVVAVVSSKSQWPEGLAPADRQAALRAALLGGPVDSAPVAEAVVHYTDRANKAQAGVRWSNRLAPLWTVWAVFLALVAASNHRWRGFAFWVVLGVLAVVQRYRLARKTRERVSQYNSARALAFEHLGLDPTQSPLDTRSIVKPPRPRRTTSRVTVRARVLVGAELGVGALYWWRAYLLSGGHTADITQVAAVTMFVGAAASVIWLRRNAAAGYIGAAAFVLGATVVALEEWSAGPWWTLGELAATAAVGAIGARVFALNEPPLTNPRR